MKELLTYIVQSLVDNPDQVSVTERKADGETVFEVRVADGDMGWGEVILSDFDDIDKHMADAQLVLANVYDQHCLDNIDYLTDEQDDR